MTYLTSLLISLGWAGACQTSDAPITALIPTDANGTSAPVIAPTTGKLEILKTGHLRIQVMINGKGPFPLVFDTGAPINLVTNKLGKECDLKKKPGRSGVTFLGPIGETNIENLTWGGATVHNVPAMVMDHPTVKLMATHFGPIEGIVGFPFFAKFRMTLNYQKAQVTLEANDYVPEDLLQGTINRFFSQEKSIPNPMKRSFGVLLDAKPSTEPCGLVVKEVLPGSAAAAAGLLRDDVVVSLAGRWTDQHPELYRILADIKPKEAVTLEIVRKNQPMKLTIKDLLGSSDD